MNPYYRLKALTHYPPWHKKPLRLSAAEIKNPWLVFDEFFNMYDLANIRDSLKLWIDDTTNSDTDDLVTHGHTCQLVEKLAEAAFLLYEEKEQAGNKESDEEEDDQEEQDQPGSQDEETNQERFSKRPFLRAAKNNPTSTIRKVFRIEEMDTLVEVIDKWCKTALANERANYHQASQRADLLCFCTGLEKLVEATWCISTITAIEERSSFPLDHAVDLQPDLLQKEQSLHLSNEELLNPIQTMQGFFDRFTLAYAKAELWDLLDSAISASNSKSGLLLQYQCLCTLLQAAWHLHQQRSVEENPEREADNDDAENEP